MADMDKNAIAQALRELDWKSVPARNREAIEQAIAALDCGDQKQPLADEAAVAPPVDMPTPIWWINHGTYGQITTRADEAERARKAGAAIYEYRADHAAARNDGRAPLEIAGATAALRECLAAEEAWSWMAQFEGDDAVDEVERARAAIRRAAARKTARKLLDAAPVAPAALKAGDPFRGGTFVGTHGEIEDALDKAGAPMQDGARWLTFPERIAALVAPAAAVPLTVAQRDSIWVAAEALEKSEEHSHAAELRAMLKTAPASTVAADALAPIPMLLFCPACGLQHIDAPEPAREGEKAWDNPPHRSHKCRACEAVWRPADVPTVGVASIQTSGQADNWDGSAHTVAAGAVRTVTIDEVEKSFLFKLLSFAWEVDIMWHRDRNEIRRIKLDVRDGVSMAPGLVERRVDLIREFVTTGRNAFSSDAGADGELVTADQTAEAAQ